MRWWKFIKADVGNSERVLKVLAGRRIYKGFSHVNCHWMAEEKLITFANPRAL